MSRRSCILRTQALAQKCEKDFLTPGSSTDLPAAVRSQTEHQDFSDAAVRYPCPLLQGTAKAPGSGFIHGKDASKQGRTLQGSCTSMGDLLRCTENLAGAPTGFPENEEGEVGALRER